jgi:hypothetical protein
MDTDTGIGTTGIRENPDPDGGRFHFVTNTHKDSPYSEDNLREGGPTMNRILKLSLVVMPLACAGCVIAPAPGEPLPGYDYGIVATPDAPVIIEPGVAVPYGWYIGPDHRRYYRGPDGNHGWHGPAPVVPPIARNQPTPQPRHRPDHEPGN